jgi:hypothetical protein
VDPGETWWERLVDHEYDECYLYCSVAHGAASGSPNVRFEGGLPNDRDRMGLVISQGGTRAVT